MTKPARDLADESASRKGDCEPRTELGRRLASLRRQLVESGERLLDWDEVERERAERQGARES